MLIELTFISLGFNSEWHFTVVTQGSFFCSHGACLGVAVTIEARRGLKGCRADWEMGHIICPWNIMWHNMTPGHLYVKVNISAWRFDKRGQGSCQCGFILAAEKEVLWHRVYVCVCECIELLFTNLIPIDTSHLVRSEKVLSGLFSCSSLFLLKALTDSWSQSFTKSVSYVCVARDFTCTGNSFNLKKCDCQTLPAGPTTRDFKHQSKTYWPQNNWPQTASAARHFGFQGLWDDGSQLFRHVAP